MKTLSFVLLLSGFCLFSSLSWGQSQYKPLSSTERHELSLGFPFSTQIWKKNLPEFFLKYSLYFPEISMVLPEPYEQVFRPGIQLGLNRSFPKELGANGGICDNSNLHPSVYHFGLKGKIPYFEALQPFSELGVARFFCHSEKYSRLSKSKTQLSHYVSYGLSLSLKVLDKLSIYALDQDYGINDLGITLECLHHYPKKTKKKTINFCQFGFQVSF